VGVAIKSDHKSSRHVSSSLQKRCGGLEPVRLDVLLANTGTQDAALVLVGDMIEEIHEPGYASQ
jgi:hypothetical protein